MIILNGNKMKYTFTTVLLLLCLFVSGFGQEDRQVKKVAILETVDKEGTINYGVKLMVRSNLAAAITSTPGYEGYDRVDVASIMSEQSFQRTGMVSDVQIKKLGEMTGASYILVAEAAKIDEDNIFITAKILNVETAKLERTTNVQTETNAEELQKSCRQLAGSLFGVAIQESENSAVSKSKQQVAQKSVSGDGEEIVFYLPGIKTSKRDSKITLAVFLDNNIIGDGTIGEGFNIKVGNILPGMHSLKIGNQVYAVDTSKFKYFEFALRKQKAALGMLNLYFTDLKVTR